MKDEALGVWEGGFVRGGWLGHRHGLVGNCKGLLDNGLGGEPPGARCMHRRQAELIRRQEEELAQRRLDREEQEARARDAAETLAAQSAARKEAEIIAQFLHMVVM